MFYQELKKSLVLRTTVIYLLRLFTTLNFKEKIVYGMKKMRNNRIQTFTYPSVYVLYSPETCFTTNIGYNFSRKHEGYYLRMIIKERYILKNIYKRTIYFKRMIALIL